MQEIRRAVREDAPVLLSLIDALAEYEKLAPPDEAARGRLVADIFGERPRLDAWLVMVDGRAGRLCADPGDLFEFPGAADALSGGHFREAGVPRPWRGCGPV